MITTKKTYLHEISKVRIEMLRPIHLKFYFLLLSGLADKFPICRHEKAYSLRRRAEHSDGGFTIIEVIVAVVILAIFILVSLTGLVAGLNMKLKAKLNNEATLLIQQDLEKVRYVAANSSITSVNGQATATISNSNITLTVPITLVDGKNTLSTSSVNNRIRIGSETDAYSLASIPSSNESTISVKLDYSKVIKSSRLVQEASTSSATIRVEDVNPFKIGNRVLVGSNSNSFSSTIYVGTVNNINTATQEITFSTNLNAAYPIPSSTSNTFSYAMVLPSNQDVNNPDIVADISVCSGNTISSKAMVILSNLSLATDFPPNSTISPNPVISPNPMPTAPTDTTTVAQVKFNDRDYEITRKASQAPAPTSINSNQLSNYRVQLYYSVIDKAVPSSATLAELKTEVIPNVTFQCP